MEKTDNYQPSKRMHRARSEVNHTRSSVSSMKEEFRNKFFNRLRHTRSRSVDRFRQIVENYGDKIHYRSLTDLRKALLADKEATELLNTDEVSNILEQVEQEMQQLTLQLEAEKYDKECSRETDEIVNRLMNNCRLCESLIIDNNICQTCSSLFNSELS